MSTDQAQEEPEEVALLADPVLRGTLKESARNYLNAVAVGGLIVVIILVAFAPLSDAWRQNTLLAEQYALQAAQLANLPVDTATLSTSIKPIPRIESAGPVTTANQVVAAQTMSSLFAAKASDAANWMIFIATVALAGLFATYFRLSNRAQRGMLAAALAIGRQLAQPIRTNRSELMKQREEWNRRGQQVSEWVPSKTDVTDD